MKVRVHYNLRLFCFSVQDAKTRRVIAHEREVLLKNAKFVVSEAGRQRCLKTGQRNVHAYVVGTWIKKPKTAPSKTVEVTYNPFKYKSFVTKKSKREVKNAKLLWLVGDSCFIVYYNTKR